LQLRQGRALAVWNGAIIHRSLTVSCAAQPPRRTVCSPLARHSQR
jgi:hypothetical protein